jgi:hypothetical protein
LERARRCGDADRREDAEVPRGDQLAHETASSSSGSRREPLLKIAAATAALMLFVPAAEYR